MTKRQMRKKEKIIDTQKIAKCYQPLFEHMKNEYKLILLQDEMSDIMFYCDKVKENYKTLKEN